MGLHELETSDVTHAVSRRLSLLNAREVHVGFMADNLTVGLSFQSISGGPCVYNSTDVARSVEGNGLVCDCSFGKSWFSAKMMA